MKTTIKITTAILIILLPVIIFSQNDQLKSTIEDINGLLRQSVFRSEMFDVESTTAYSFEVGYNTLIIREELNSAFESQVKEYQLSTNDIISFNVSVNSNKDLIVIKYFDFRAEDHYIKYQVINANGNSNGLELGVNIYLGSISTENLEILDNLLKDLFIMIAGGDAHFSEDESNSYAEYYDKYYSESENYNDSNSNYDEESYESNGNDSYIDYYNNYDNENYSDYNSNDSENNFEFYNESGFRVYDQNDATYYRIIEYDDEGILIAIDYKQERGDVPFRIAQLYSRDPNNMNNDIRDGECTWYYENGKPHFYAIYENGSLVNNEYAEIDEKSNVTIIFNDSFVDNRNKWSITNDTYGYSEIVSEYFYFESKREYRLKRLIRYEIDTEKDFIIESEFKLESGNSEQGQGIVWGYKDLDNYFSFKISSDGYYKITAYHDGLTLNLSDSWVKSDKIRNGFNWNKLQLNKYDEKMYFSINGKIVKELDFYTFKGNYMGFEVGGNRKIKVSNLTVKQKLGTINTEEDSYASGKKRGANNSGEIKGTGSGIVLTRDGYIATNYHVAGDANEIAVAFYKNNERKVYNANYIVGDIEHDLAIIKIDDDNFTGFAEIPYSFKIDDADVGEEVFTLGYPFTDITGAEIIFNEGTISSLYGYNRDDALYQISVPVQPGNSGGPLFDFNGNLTGIIVSRLEKIRDHQAENMAYAIKTYYLKRLIDKLPNRINIPSSYSTSYMRTSEKIKILKEFVPILLIK